MPKPHGPGQVTKHIDNQDEFPCRASENLNCLDLESAWNAGLTWFSGLMEQPGTWARNYMLPLELASALCPSTSNTHSYLSLGFQCSHSHNCTIEQMSSNNNLSPLLSGWKLNTEGLANRGSKIKQRRAKWPRKWKVQQIKTQKLIQRSLYWGTIVATDDKQKLEQSLSDTELAPQTKQLKINT